MSRNHSYEREWIHQVAHQAGLGGVSERFTDLVFERLDKGAQEYGDAAFLDAGARLFNEQAEEGVDLCAWGVLCSQWLAHEEQAGLDSDDAHAIRLRLIEAAANAVRAWHALEAAQELYRDTHAPH